MTPESMKTMQNDMDLEFDPRRVANFLKQIITRGKDCYVPEG